VQCDEPLIMIAEDNTTIQMLLDEIFTDEGYAVACYPSASAALDALQECCPALMIADMQMEHAVAGLQLLRRVREAERTSALPVIVYSADALLLRTLKPQIEELAGVAVPKPFDISALVELAHSLIDPREREVAGPAGL
jgi:two-component system response regulator (stage 0 sporulation protein F)